MGSELQDGLGLGRIEAVRSTARSFYYTYIYLYRKREREREREGERINKYIGGLGELVRLVRPP